MNRMRSIIIGAGLTTLLSIGSYQQASAQAGIVEAVRLAATKIIKAVDLMVQRLQNKTIWLQEAQKEVENVLSQTKLQEIAGWVQQQKDLYGTYFDELAQVKLWLSEYHRVKTLMARQAAILSRCQQAMALFRQDGHFTPEELAHIGAVYQGILDESLEHLDQVLDVLRSLATHMTDEERLRIINTAADQVDQNYSDLQAFTRQNQVLSLQRSKDQEEVNQVKKIYGLP